MKDFFERYERWLMPIPFCGCLIWTGTATSGRNNNGYGWARRRGEFFYAHRAAYEAVHGTGSADGWMVRHACDVPLCCNPDHLSLGNHADNARDMRERGRSLRGERQHQSKLKRQTVALIRLVDAIGMSQVYVGDLLSVSQATVSAVALGKRWGAYRMHEEIRLLRKWIEANPDKVDGCTRVLPAQLWTAKRYPKSDAARKIVAESVARLATVLNQ